MNIAERFVSFVISAVGDFVNGIDVSVWQGLMNWLTAKNAGVVYAFIRAGSINNVTGVPYTDDQFIRNSDLAPIHIKHIGYYWYFRPNHDPVKQARYFANLIRDVYWTLPPVVDVETAGGLSPDQVRIALKTFIKTLKEELGIKFVIIYTRQSFWDSNVAPDAVFQMMPLFAARYHSLLTSPWSDGNFVFRDWLDWAFWQYWADKNGQGSKYGAQSADIDLDRFNGDMAAFEQFVAAYGRPVNEPDPPSDDLAARVAALEAQVAQHQSTLDAVVKVANAAGNQAEANRLSVVALAANLTKANQRITALQNDVTALKNTVTGIAGVNGKQDTAINVLVERVKKLEDRITQVREAWQ